MTNPAPDGVLVPAPDGFGASGRIRACRLHREARRARGGRAGVVATAFGLELPVIRARLGRRGVMTAAAVGVFAMVGSTLALPPARAAAEEEERARSGESRNGGPENGDRPLVHRSQQGPHDAQPGGPLAPALPGVLLSRQLLEEAGLSVGDAVSLAKEPSGAEALAFRIVGIYEPTPDPMRITLKRREARLHLPDLLSLVADPADPLAGETVDSLNGRLCDPEDAGSFVENLRARIPGVIPLPTRGLRDATFAVLDRFHLAIAIVTVLGSTAFLLALMVMRADERRETVGILRLIGLSRRRILVEVLFEGLLIAAAGALFGVLFAAAMEGAVNRFFQWRYDTALVFMRVTPGIALKCVALSVPLGVLAGLVASWSILRGDATSLLRR